MRPYVICHMMASLNGRIDCKILLTIAVSLLLFSCSSDNAQAQTANYETMTQKCTSQSVEGLSQLHLLIIVPHKHL